MPNKVFTFIHAADLHLGAPFKGLTQVNEFEYSQEGDPSGFGWLGKNLFNATYKALDRLVELCLHRRPHALLLAGDLYNPETNGLKSLTALRQAFLSLQNAGIVVCLVHGNHDPASSIPPSWVWPENTHAFSAEKPEAVGVFFTPHQGCRLQVLDENIIDNNLIYEHAGEHSEEQFNGYNQQPLAVIYGISHSSAAVTDNLAKKISQQSLKHNFNNSAIFQIGLVHCAVGTPGGDVGEHKPHAPYAPCALEDLNSARLNYWALGHIHKQGMVTAQPLAIYPGNTQGLHINEQGPKGCVWGALQAGLDPKLEFCALGGVQWRQIDFELTAQCTASSIEDELYEQLLLLTNNLHLQTSSLQNMPLAASNVPASGCIVRLHLTGRTALNRYLRENVEYLLASLRKRLAPGAHSDSAPFIWLKDIKLNTQPMQNLELASKRDNLLGESLRRLQAAKHDQDLYNELLKDSKSPLGQLFASNNARQAGLVAPSPTEWVELLDEAAALCAELLGAEQDNEFEYEQAKQSEENENSFPAFPQSTR